MKTEIRTFVLRTDPNEEEFSLCGKALSYDTLSADLGNFFERVMPNAFAESLASGSDVKCLLNHDPSRVLGRLQNGTLTLTDARDGLYFRCQLDRENPSHQDVYRMVRRGDVSECSFSFTVADGGETYDNIMHEGRKIVRRTVTKGKIFDVSAVCYPAYSTPGSTSVSARTTHAGTQLLSTQASPRNDRPLVTSPAALDAWNRRRAEEIGREIAADSKPRTLAKPTTPAEIDAYNRARCEEVGRIVSEDRRKGDI